MTNPAKWTDANVGSVRPLPNQAGVISNDCKVKCPGIGRNGAPMPNLAIRFQNGNPVGVYSYYFSVNGRHQVKAIGKVGSMLLADVVKRSQEFALLVSEKKSPITEEIREAAKAGQLFSVAMEGFQGHLRKLGRTELYIRDTARNLNRMPALHPLPLGDIDRGMVAAQLNQIEEKHGERQAGLARAQLSSMYTYAMQELGYLGANPVEGTRNRASNVRDRVLNEKEIVLIWKATEEPTDFNTIVRLLLLTAARLAMIALLPKAEIKLDENRIEVDKSRMKGGLNFWVALSRQAKTILEKVKDRRPGSPFVFGQGEGGYSGYSKSMERLYERITELNGGKEIPHWTLHDFRRTFTTMGSEHAGIDERDADLCLSHFGGGVRAGSKKHYNHAKFFKEKMSAVQAWADYVDGLVHGKREFKVVENA